MNDVLFEQLDQAISEAEMAQREAFQESMKRRKAEKEALDAARKVKSLKKWSCLSLFFFCMENVFHMLVYLAKLT